VLSNGHLREEGPHLILQASADEIEIGGTSTLSPAALSRGSGGVCRLAISEEESGEPLGEGQGDQRKGREPSTGRWMASSFVSR
jgi:hypothetical protein